MERTAAEYAGILQRTEFVVVLTLAGMGCIRLGLSRVLRACSESAVTSCISAFLILKPGFRFRTTSMGSGVGFTALQYNVFPFLDFVATALRGPGSPTSSSLRGA